MNYSQRSQQQQSQLDSSKKYVSKQGNHKKSQTLLKSVSKIASRVEKKIVKSFHHQPPYSMFGQNGIEMQQQQWLQMIQMNNMLMTYQNQMMRSVQQQVKKNAKTKKKKSHK